MAARSSPFWLPLLILSSSLTTWAGEPADESSQEVEPSSLNSNPVGIGTVITQGRDNDVRSGIVMEGSNHFRQRTGLFGIRQYGFAQSRAEWTGGFGVALHSAVGMTVVGLRQGDRAAIQLGVEPFAGRISLRARSTGRTFYEWQPMASAGLQLALGSCRWMGLLRGGGALGNYFRTGWLPQSGLSAGVSFLGNCDRLDLGFESLRFSDRSHWSGFKTFDLTWNVPDSRWRMGARLESIGSREDVNSERRWMLITRMNPFEP